MSELTLEAIDKLLDDKLEPISTTLAAVQETVSSHTEILATQSRTLDAIAKGVSDLTIEKAALIGRLDRHEQIIKELAQRAGLKLDW